MPRTVAQEMSPEERRNRLIAGLQATSAEKVVLNFSHLAHALGMKKAQELTEKVAEIASAGEQGNRREAFCEVDRLQVLMELKKAASQPAQKENKK